MVSGQLHTTYAVRQAKLRAVPISQEAWRAPEPVGTLWRREKSYTVGSRAWAVQLIEDKYKMVVNCIQLFTVGYT
jgi:hypothetical protein